MGWLDNALPEILDGDAEFACIFLRYSVYGQCLSYIDDASLLGSSFFFNGSKVPRWLSNLVRRARSLHSFTDLSDACLGFLFRCLPKFLPQSIQEPNKSNLIYADFGNEKVFGNRLSDKFRQGTCVHVDHGLNLVFNYSERQMKSLERCSYFLCWTSCQSKFFEEHFGASRVIKSAYNKLHNPIIWRGAACQHDPHRKKIIFISRPLDPAYIKHSDFEVKFESLIRVCIEFGFDIMIKQHPKEVSSKPYSRYLGRYHGIEVSLFSGQLSDLSKFKCQFAVSVYTGTVFETLSMGVPNIQLACNSSKLKKSTLHQYSDYGVTEIYESGSTDELIDYFLARNSILQNQTCHMRSLLWG